jgi:hypothetical protein
MGRHLVESEMQSYYESSRIYETVSDISVPVQAVEERFAKGRGVNVYLNKESSK